MNSKHCGRLLLHPLQEYSLLRNIILGLFFSTSPLFHFSQSEKKEKVSSSFCRCVGNHSCGRLLQYHVMTMVFCCCFIFQNRVRVYQFFHFIGSIRPFRFLCLTSFPPSSSPLLSLVSFLLLTYSVLLPCKLVLQVSSASMVDCSALKNSVCVVRGRHSIDKSSSMSRWLPFLQREDDKYKVWTYEFGHQSGRLRVHLNMVGKALLDDLKLELFDNSMFRQYNVRSSAEPRVHVLLHEDATDVGCRYVCEFLSVHH